MTYNTPELLTIGSARNIVLAGVSDAVGCYEDNLGAPNSDKPELW
jgi:hypothetical protein